MEKESEVEHDPDAAFHAAQVRMRNALPYLQYAVELAKKKGEPFLAIVAEFPDKSGSVMSRFQCEDFFNDLMLLAGGTPLTDEARIEAAAMSFMHTHGLSL